MKKKKIGCGTIFIVFLAIGLVIEYWYIGIPVILIAAAYWYFKIYPEKRALKIQKEQEIQEEKNIAAEERRLELEKRKLMVENQQREIQDSRTTLNKTEWKCSFCMNTNSPERNECSSCGAKKD
ncbi:zinc finger Ran-binding domain-containing protein [Enterococcus sp. AZ072]|uniref:zinc finger Ran-binding domain-containing protein n=1 Tax=unclassified Enterococcus TaxID=2608891 RepID=UPI003D2DE659